MFDEYKFLVADKAPSLLPSTTTTLIATAQEGPQKNHAPPHHPRRRGNNATASAGAGLHVAIVYSALRATKPGALASECADPPTTLCAGVVLAWVGESQNRFFCFSQRQTHFPNIAMRRARVCVRACVHAVGGLGAIRASFA